MTGSGLRRRRAPVSTSASALPDSRGFYAGSSQMTDVVWIGPGNVEGGSGQRAAPPRSAAMALQRHDDGPGVHRRQRVRPLRIEGARSGHRRPEPEHHRGSFLDGCHPRVDHDDADRLALGLEHDRHRLHAVGDGGALGSRHRDVFRDGVSLGSAAVGTSVTDRVADARRRCRCRRRSSPATRPPSRDRPLAAVSYAITAPAPAGPTVTVSKTTGLDPAGETVTVTGTGFLPSAPATNGTRRPLSGAFARHVRRVR